MDKGIQEQVKNARFSMILKGCKVNPEPTEEELYEVLCYTRSLLPNGDRSSARFSYKNHQLVLYVDKLRITSYNIYYDMAKVVADYNKIATQEQAETKESRLHMIIKGGIVDPEPMEEEWSEVFDRICDNFSDYDDVSLRYEDGSLYVYSEGEIIGRYIFPYDISQAFESYHYMKKLNEEAPVDDSDLEDIPEDDSKTPRDRVKEIALKQANEIVIEAKPEEIDQIILILVNNGYLVQCKREFEKPDVYKISYL